MRREKDFIGELQIPNDALYGINGARARENFGDFGEGTDPLFIKAFLLVKKACALASHENGYLSDIKTKMITDAVDELIKGDDNNQVIVNPISGGAGTPMNMNINELIANKALVLNGYKPGDYHILSPVDDVNLHQSTNDTYPSAFKTAVMFYLKELEPALASLQDSLQEKEKEYSDVIKLGRTELMDALPMTVGMQFSAYAEAIARDRWRVFKANERIKTLNLGGTATGTGFNAPQKYIFSAVNKLREITGLNISRAENLVDATQNLDSVVEVMAIVKTASVNLMKIAGDLRLQSGGPDGGIGEFILPAVQEGSSIMPGKVNPVIPEFVQQASMLIMGNDSVISNAASQGNFELNQFYPLVAALSLKNLWMLTHSIKLLDRGCIKGLKLNREKVASNLSSSVAVLTYLSQYIGHDKAAVFYQRYKNGEKDIKKMVTESGLIDNKTYDELVNSNRFKMTGLKDGDK
ncbi:MAG: aspartate ammonia-lyase [Candidatus Goldbacteria bacterium]|nr:aspartate ammonia-lyase [Candidatus Goldiibacteriota bacterium]